MVYNLSNRRRTKENLYYFTSHNYGISNIIHNRLKVSLYSNINDCHELLPFRDGEEYYEALTIWVQSFQKKYGFVSFSRYWDNPLMWGHYTNNNGICLGFDCKKSGIALDVHYRIEKLNREEVLKRFSSSSYSEMYINEMLTTKSIDWEYEQETRIIKNLIYKDPEAGCYFYNLDKDLVLDEIIIAPRSEYCPNDIKLFLRSINYPEEVKIFKVIPSNKYFLMEIDSKYNITKYNP